MPDPHPDGAALKATRLQLGLTQGAMAEKMRTPLVTYKSWEAGRFRPPGVALAWCDLVMAVHLGATRKSIDHNEVLRLYNTGMLGTEIARHLGASKQAVYAILRSRGILGRPKAIDREEVLRLSAAGMSTSEIGQTLGYGRPYVAQVLCRLRGLIKQRVDHDEAVRLYQSGLSGPQVAAALGCRQAIVYRILAERGIRARSRGCKGKT